MISEGSSDIDHDDGIRPWRLNCTLLLCCGLTFQRTFWCLSSLCR